MDLVQCRTRGGRFAGWQSWDGNLNTDVDQDPGKAWDRFPGYKIIGFSCFQLLLSACFPHSWRLNSIPFLWSENPSALLCWDYPVELTSPIPSRNLNCCWLNSVNYSDFLDVKFSRNMKQACPGHCDFLLLRGRTVLDVDSGAAGALFIPSPPGWLFLLPNAPVGLLFPPLQIPKSTSFLPVPPLEPSHGLSVPFAGGFWVPGRTDILLTSPVRSLPSSLVMMAWGYVAVEATTP